MNRSGSGKVFAEAAVLAAERAAKDSSASAAECWQIAIKFVTDKKSMHKKECPLNAFLGLCNSGLVRGVSPKPNEAATKNGKYAVKAYALLKAKPSLAAAGEQSLWTAVLESLDEEDPDKEQNQQMQVVLALWPNHLIP